MEAPGGDRSGRYHAAIDRLRSLPWLRVARVLFALYLVGALISVWLPGDWRQADVSLYRTDALAFWGHLAHPSLPHEYPPLAVIPFSLTLMDMQMGSVEQGHSLGQTQNQLLLPGAGFP